MISRIIIPALLAVALTLGLFGDVAQAQRPQFLSIGGGMIGGTFNVFAMGMADYLSREFPHLRVTVEGSAGSAENIRRIQGGEMEMGIAFAGDAFLAYNGLEDFADRRHDRIRAIGFLYSAVSQLVTLEGSGIHSLHDLAGKRIAVGPAGSGTHLLIERLLRQVGVWEHVTPVFVGGLASSEKLKNRHVEAYHVLLGVPNATVLDTSTTHDIVILSTYQEARTAGFFDKFPFYSRFIIPGSTYRGVKEDVEAFRDAGILVVSSDLDEELVYQLTKAMFSEAGREHMLSVTKVAAEMGPENALVGIALPLHPGAARFWQEVGVEIPEVARP